MGTRNPYIDNIKGILVFLVVFAHLLANCIGYSNILNTLYIFIYTFHIPLFVFVSGYLSKNPKSQGSALLNFLGLYFFVSVTSIFLSDITYFLYSNPWPMSFPSFGLTLLSFFKEAVLSIFLAVGPVWYLLSLICWRIFAPYFNKKRFLIFSFAAAVLAGGVPQIGNALSLSRTIVFFPFYLAGYLLKPGLLEKFAEKTDKLIIKFAALISGAGLLVLCYFNNINYQILYGFSSYSLCGYSFTDGALRRIYVFALAAVISVCVLIILPRKKFIAENWGKHSLNVYIWHIYLLPAAVISEKILSAGAWYSLFAFIASLGICFVFSTSIFDKITDFIKNKINKIMFGSNIINETH